MSRIALVAILLAGSVSACVSGSDGDAYWCNRPEMCSHAADARHLAQVAADRERQAELDARNQRVIDAEVPEAHRQAAEYRTRIARLTPEQRREYYEELNRRSLILQQQRDRVDRFNEATGTLKQCGAGYCW